MELKPLNLIVAMSSPGGVIGKDGKLPWSIPEDMKHFRELTTGHAIIMGRKTFESIGRPLPKRTNIVMSRHRDLSDKNVWNCLDLDQALASAYCIDKSPFVIGGAEIYALALPLTTTMHLTLVDEPVEGDTFFPEVDWSEWFLRSVWGCPGRKSVSFHTWERRK